MCLNRFCYSLRLFFYNGISSNKISLLVYDSNLRLQANGTNVCRNLTLIFHNLLFILDSCSVGMNIFSVNLGLLRCQSTECSRFMVAFSVDPSVYADCCITVMYQCLSWVQWKHCATPGFCWAMGTLCVTSVLFSGVWDQNTERLS